MRVTRSTPSRGRVEVVFGPQLLDPDQQRAERHSQQQRRQQHHAGEPERTDQDVGDTGRFDRLVEDADEDR